MCQPITYNEQERWVVAMRFKGAISRTSENWQRFAREVHNQEIPVSGWGISAYITEGEFDPNDVEYELMFPIEGEAHAEPPLKIKKLPAGEVASIIHRGPFDGIGAAYDTLFKWINQQGLSPAGYAREVHLRCPHNTTDPKGLVTEIQVPVRPSS